MIYSFKPPSKCFNSPTAPDTIIVPVTTSPYSIMGFTYPTNLDKTGFTPASSQKINVPDPPTPLEADLDNIKPFNVFFLPFISFLPNSSITSLAALQSKGLDGLKSLYQGVCVFICSL
ncbi:MAG: hypothetical protein BWY36_00979 [Candidatus Diapherotrites archaeon ADurb.Bin253]|nr:MAG: hypothetical protein BWY36_00979 [Candidatus Diapherotrites archaeon ADurb.Bin253]